MAEETLGPTKMPAHQSPAQTKLLKYALFALAGVLLLAGATYVGYWYRTEPKTQIQEEPTLSPTPTSVVEDEIKDWKTYKSREYNFEIKYPPSWQISMDKPMPKTTQVNEKPIVILYEGQLKMYPNNGAGVLYPSRFVSLTVLDSEQTPKQYLDDIIKRHPNDDTTQLINRELYTISNLPAEIYTEPEAGGRGRIVLVSHNKRLFFLNFRINEQSDIANPLDPDVTIDQILSTFKFMV